MKSLSPRNYFAVDVDRVETDGCDQPHHLLHSRLLTGAVALEIDVLTPVHVGSGSYGLVEGRMVKTAAVRDGRPIVPGTSIKGICRQTHEVLTRSTSPFDRRGGPQGPTRSETLFGRLGYQGRISFDDAVPLSLVHLEVVGLSVPYEPQKAVGRRFYGPMPKGANQPARIEAEAIPRGTTLVTVLRFRNVHKEELGSLLQSLGVGGFTPKLGGGKYDPYGWVRFRVVRYRLRSGIVVRARPWEEDPDKVKAFCADLAELVRLPPDGDNALRKLTERMQAPVSETERGSS